MVTTETCLLLGLVHIVLSSRTALLASLTGSRITGFEASARSLSTLGSDVSLLLRVHAGKPSRVGALTTLAGNVLNLLVGTVAEVSGVRVRGHYELMNRIIYKIVW